MRDTPPTTAAPVAPCETCAGPTISTGAVAMHVQADGSFSLMADWPHPHPATPADRVRNTNHQEATSGPNRH